MTGKLSERMPLAEMPDLVLDSDISTAMFRQLYLALREQVLDGRLRPGTRLPSSRALAGDLGVGRNTVIAAFDQLLAEGYLETRKGSGTYIAEVLPETWHSAKPLPTVNHSGAARLQLSDYAELMSRETIRSGQTNQSFCVGVPNLRAFPAKVWNRLQQQVPSAGLTEIMGFNDPMGYQPLREAVADYVRSSRAVNCEAEQILITTGAQQALDLCARLLLNSGDQAVLENPGYLGARRALLAAGAELVPCPVDHQGMMVQKLDGLTENPRLIYVTPAHQYPMGPVLPLERRAELLEWAYQNQCWVLEDDYDSEYHYQHRPLSSLQGLDRQQQVINIGSFSKVLFPALRLGYLVLPQALVSTFVKAKMEHSGDTSLHTQATVAAFMQEGHFSRHLKRMRLLYAKTLEVMLEACQGLKPWCRIHEYGAGMHLVLEFTSPLPEQAVYEQLRQSGILCSRLSSYYFRDNKKFGLVLGFTNSSPTEIEKGVEKIRKILTAWRQ
ncbi:MAG: PLP-dependent aminotransferase family protein [Endozoicomonas sp.]